MICTNCGFNITEPTNFCPNCGANVNAPSTATPPSSPYAQPTPPSTPNYTQPAAPVGPQSAPPVTPATPNPPAPTYQPEPPSAPVYTQAPTPVSTETPAEASNIPADIPSTEATDNSPAPATPADPLNYTPATIPNDAPVGMAILAKLTKKQKIIGGIGIIGVIAIILVLQMFINNANLAPTASPIPTLAPSTAPQPAAPAYSFLEPYIGDSLKYKMTVTEFTQAWNNSAKTGNIYADSHIGDVNSITDNGDGTSTYSYHITEPSTNKTRLIFDLSAENNTTKITSFRFTDPTTTTATPTPPPTTPSPTPSPTPTNPDTSPATTPAGDTSTAPSFVKASGILSTEASPYPLAQNTWDVLQGSPEYINNGVWHKIAIYSAGLSILAIPDEPLPNIDYTPNRNVKAMLVANKWEADNLSYILQYNDDGTYLIDYSQSPNNKNQANVNIQYRMSDDVVYAKNGKDCYQQRVAISGDVLTITNIQTGGISTCHKYYAPGETPPATASPLPSNSSSPLPSNIR